MSVHRERVSIRRLRWRAGFNRHLATALLLVVAVLAGWRSLHPPQRVIERVVATDTLDLPAGVYAQRFAAAFLAFDATDPAARERALAEFDGSQTGITAEGFQPPNSGTRTVTGTAMQREVKVPGATRVLVEATTKPGGRTYVSVDVRRTAEGALQLVGPPAIVGAPLQAGAASAPTGRQVDDTDVTRVAARALRNYLDGSTDDLAADLTPEAVVSTPTHPMRLVRVQQLAWEPDVPTSVLATVSARDEAGVQLDLLYELALNRRGTRWFVSGIHTNPTGH